MQLGAMVMYGAGGVRGNGLAAAGVLFVEHVLSTHTHTYTRAGTLAQSDAQRAHT